MKKICLVFTFAVFAISLYGQTNILSVPSSGGSDSTHENLWYGPTNWSTPANISVQSPSNCLSSDTYCAYMPASACSAAPPVTCYGPILYGTANFSSLPAGAHVTGVEFSFFVWMNTQYAGGSIQTFEVGIYPGCTTYGGSCAAEAVKNGIGTAWNGASTCATVSACTETYGSSSDLWAASSLTAANLHNGAVVFMWPEVNDISSGTNSVDPRTNNWQLTVYYVLNGVSHTVVQPVALMN